MQSQPQRASVKSKPPARNTQEVKQLKRQLEESQTENNQLRQEILKLKEHLAAERQPNKNLQAELEDKLNRISLTSQPQRIRKIQELSRQKVEVQLDSWPKFRMNFWR